jgi:ABC-type branched-subunit amino acid transport system ATPase component
VSSSLRAAFTAAAARPAVRALRAPLVLAGTVAIGVRLVLRSLDQDAGHGLAALVLVAASVAVVAWMTRRGVAVLRSSLPVEAIRPTLLIAAITVLVGGYAVGAPLLASLERRYGQLWAATLLLAAALLVGRRFGRQLPALGPSSRADGGTARTGRGRPPLLACHGIDFGYGKLQVLHGVDLEVGEGELVALLGVNGAGKSTMLRAISGLGLPTAGSIRFDGEDITYLDAESRVRRGISQVPGGRAVFGSLTVIDNLRSYAYTLDRRRVDPAIDRALAAFPRLEERRNQAAGTLSGGEQQMLAMAKALMLEPRLLLIDELSLGLAPIIVGQLLDVVRDINATGTAVVLVEQSVNIALHLADHAFFMERGAVQFDGRSTDLLAREDLLRAVFLDGAAAR